MATFSEWRKRIVAVVAAVLFLMTSVGFTILVVMQTRKDSDASKKAAEVQKALTATKTPAPVTATTKPQENKLEGTQLANFTPVAQIADLQSVDTVEGTGDVVNAGATVTAHYTGAVAATGVIFQSSHDGQNQPIAFPLSGVIKGWTQGVPGMKVGGTRRLLIPAALAYGANPPQGSGIPANADLVFDIELTAVKQ